LWKFHVSPGRISSFPIVAALEHTLLKDSNAICSIVKMADDISSASPLQSSLNKPEQSPLSVSEGAGEEKTPKAPVSNPRKSTSSSASRRAPSVHASVHASSHKKPTYNYLTLAQKLGNEPGFAIFRRFATLNAKSLLYLQAELTLLEDELEYLESEDQDAEDETKRNFQWEARLLIEHLEDDEEESQEESSEDVEGEAKVVSDEKKMKTKKQQKKSAQWEKMLEIRTKLKEYSACPFSLTLLDPYRSPVHQLQRTLRCP
jgi:hypothetical protein